MRSYTRLLFVLLGAVGVLVAPARAQKIKVATETVPVYVSVTDQDKRLVPDLVQKDFEIYDNGKLQTVTTFNNTPQAITTVVMLDSSGSMTPSLDLVKEAAEQFLIRLLPQDRGMVGAFNDKIEFHPPGFTANRDFLVSSLKELDFGNGTRLYDAVDQSIDQLQDVEGRRVIVVFTDGQDTASRSGSRSVTDRARTEEVMVYSIGFVSEYFNGQQKVRSSPDRGLRRLSDETGGGFFLLKKTAELGPTFTRVAQELHSQYALGFSPEKLDGKVHKLEVRLRKPGMTPQARKSYVATPAAATSEK